MIKQTISGTPIDLSPSRKPIQLEAGYHRKLKTLAFEKDTQMTKLIEAWIEAEWQRTHPQSIFELISR